MDQGNDIIKDNETAPETTNASTGGLQMSEILPSTETTAVEDPTPPSIEALPDTSTVVAPTHATNAPDTPEPTPLATAPPPQPTPTQQANVELPTTTPPLRELLPKLKSKLQERTEQRLMKILQLAKLKRSVTNDDVQKLLRVSDATASRYLKKLLQQNKLKTSGKARRPKYEPVGE